mmetsp:Transcript_16187/g.15531  ORF Transcript_16187/g.15531 Transcript_16187/m.15531 type:complete len:249 (-) Transcript_16187:37-783(-)
MAKRSGNNLNDRRQSERVRRKNDLPLFHIIILNDLIYEQLQGFIGHDVAGYFRNYYAISMNNLLNVSKKFSALKKDRFYLDLNEFYSFKYYSDKIFKSKVNPLLKSTNKQLSLNLRNRLDISNLKSLRNVHALSLSHCSNITDVCFLGNIHKLDLSSCCSPKDVSALSRVHTLDLSHRLGVIDVSSLRDVHTLNLSYCYEIVDVSTLGQVHDLNIPYRNVVDLSALGGGAYIKSLYNDQSQFRRALMK